MPELIEIHDTTEAGYLAFDLIDILPLLGDNCSSLIWSILDLEVRSKANVGLNVPELERKCRETPRGLIVTWDELRRLASKFKQTIDGVFVGCLERTMVPRLDRQETWHDLCEVVIEAIDSTSWRIYAKDGRLLDNVKGRFHEWRSLPVD